MEGYREGGGGYERFCCRQCGLLSRGEMPSEEETVQWYRESYWNQFGEEQLGTARENVCRHVMERIVTAHQSPGLLVDIGCGAGALLKCGAGVESDLNYPGLRSAKHDHRGWKSTSRVGCPVPCMLNRLMR